MKVALTLCVFGAVLAELSSARQFLFDEQILEEGNGDPADKIRTVDAAITSKETEEDDYNDLDDSEDASIPYITEEEEIKLRIENFKMELRNKLPGLPPPGTGMTSLPPAFKSIRDSQLQRNGTEQTKLSQQVLVADTVNKREDGIKMHFDLQRIPSEGNIVSIKLWLHTRSSQAGNNHSYVVTESPGLSDEKPPVILASETGSDKSGWISFEITLSDKYTSGIGRALGLKVRCATCSNGFLPVVLDGDQQPFLVVDYTQSIARAKRSTRSNWCAPNQSSCCRMRFELNFNEVGLYEVLAPPSVEFNFCRGSCVAMVSQALVGNRTLGAYLPQPEGCCRPKELSSFPIVIYSRGHVVLQYLRESVVKSCGCS